MDFITWNIAVVHVTGKQYGVVLNEAFVVLKRDGSGRLKRMRPQGPFPSTNLCRLSDLPSTNFYPTIKTQPSPNGWAFCYAHHMPSLFSLGLSIVLLNLAIGAVLLWRYFRTRESATLWLGMAIFVWPFVLSIGQKLFFRWAALHIDVISTFRTTQALGSLVGIGLLLVAMIHLSKAGNRQSAR